jgi:capsular polysaccharide biosynthesis protein
MVRKNEFKRLLMPANEICEVAEQAGFQLIAPEEHSVADQVRLFAAARAIAGPDGAAFTNMLFCRQGTKSMPIMREESDFPTFTDMAISLGLPIRYCLAQTDKHCLAYGENLKAEPYSVDLRVLAQQLAWARA